MTFATLFLGLVVGVHPVELVLANEDVARVELHLDGKHVGTLTDEPWVTECDFGTQLRPRELRATAYDADGEQIDQAVQLVNLPRPIADVRVALVRDGDGRVTGARFVWEGVAPPSLEGVSVRLDGRSLRMDDPGFVSLPAVDLGEPHVLEAVFRFRSGLRLHTDATFGGQFGEEVDTEITAVPVLLADPGDDSWLSEARFEVRGRSVAVTAAADSPADVIFVPEGGVRSALLRFQIGRKRSMSLSLRYALGLGNARMRLLRPYSQLQPGVRYSYNVFRPSQEFTSGDGGVYWLLSQVGEDAPETRSEHTAAAAATAGLIAAREGRRRAVVVVLDGGTEEDPGPFTPPEVECFLSDLKVPLYVWSVAPSASSRWSDVREISSLSALSRAVKELERDLARQTVLWLEGSHLPNEVRIMDSSARLTFPGRACGRRSAGAPEIDDTDP